MSRHWRQRRIRLANRYSLVLKLTAALLILWAAWGIHSHG